MLSRSLFRLTSTLARTQTNSIKTQQACRLTMLAPVAQCGFRSHFMNPYRNNPTPLSQAERDEQAVRPVWERVFDHKKYMQHDGPLKLSTGIAYLDVEPFPRMKLMKLYYLTLDEINQLPDVYSYKFLSRELTRFRMQVVDEHDNIREIEEKISSGLIEELIFQAHNELKLLRLIRQWKPWEEMVDDDDTTKEMLHNFASFRHDNPFPVVFENYDAQRYDRPPRDKPTSE